MNTATQVASLAERLTALCEEFDQLRPRVRNIQFNAANGYLMKAEIHLTNAAKDFQEGIDVEPPPGGRGHPVDPERLHFAARTWRQAKDAGVPTKRAVAEALDISLPQASVYVRRARELGLIPAKAS